MRVQRWFNPLLSASTVLLAACGLLTGVGDLVVVDDAGVSMGADAQTSDARPPLPDASDATDAQSDGSSADGGQEDGGQNDASVADAGMDADSPMPCNSSYADFLNGTASPFMSNFGPTPGSVQVFGGTPGRARLAGGGALTSPCTRPNGAPVRIYGEHAFTGSTGDLFVYTRSTHARAPGALGDGRLVGIGCHYRLSAAGLEISSFTQLASDSLLTDDAAPVVVSTLAANKPWMFEVYDAANGLTCSARDKGALIRPTTYTGNSSVYFGLNRVAVANGPNVGAANADVKYLAVEYADLPLPAHQWDFEEPSISPLINLRASEDPMATSPSGVVHVPGTFGQAGLFNAAGLLTYSGSPPLGSFGTANFTISFWMRDDYASTNAARRYILGNRSTTIASPGPYITASTGGIPSSLFFAFSMKDAAGNAVDVVWNDPNNRIKSGKWTHIALRRQVGVAEIFVDGNIAMAGETASKLAVDLGPTAANFTIGRIPQADPPMTGGIDGLRIYRGVALTPTQIAALATPIPRP